PGVTGGRRGRILADAGFASGTQTRPSNPIERRQDQERDGVEAEAIYGITGISRGLFTHSGIADHETLAAVYRAYNDYIADFNRSQPGRFFGLGCLPNYDAAAAADEVRHCAELGLRGGVFVPWGSASPVWHQMWEPRWAAAEETGPVIPPHLVDGGPATAGPAVQDTQHPASGGAGRTGEASSRGRWRAVGLGRSARGRPLAFLAGGDRGAVPRHPGADPVEDALGERTPGLQDRRAGPKGLEVKPRERSRLAPM